MQTYYPLITSIVALVFAVLVLRQYLQRRGTHQLVWAIALFVFAFAAFCEFYSEVWGWPVLMFVGFLQAGTLREKMRTRE